MTPETEALIARLEITYLHRMDGLPMRSQYVNPDGPLAVATIREQAAEIERLREALVTFIRCAYPVCQTIQPLGYNWMPEKALDYALMEARKALGEQL